MRSRILERLDKHVKQIYVLCMQLTLYTDYSLRVLIYLGEYPDRLVTIGEIARFYNISRNHLVKVVHNVGKIGYIHTSRGRSGGLQLAMPPEDIVIGQLVRHTEPHLDLLECFDMANNTCPVATACTLKGALYQARKAFMDVLDSYTLADVLGNKDPAWIPLTLQKSGKTPV